MPVPLVLLDLADFDRVMAVSSWAMLAGMFIQTDVKLFKPCNQPAPTRGIMPYLNGINRTNSFQTGGNGLV
jgi:hypothetical protein